jgi:hypothetical protein
MRRPSLGFLIMSDAIANGGLEVYVRQCASIGDLIGPSGVLASNSRFERSRVSSAVGHGGVSMIEIKLLRIESMQPRVAQPMRIASSEVLLNDFVASSEM